MRKVKCLECDGTGIWVNDEYGNAYAKPYPKCKDCDGKGVIEFEETEE